MLYFFISDKQTGVSQEDGKVAYTESVYRNMNNCDYIITYEQPFVVAKILYDR